MNIGLYFDPQSAMCNYLLNGELPFGGLEASWRF